MKVVLTLASLVLSILSCEAALAPECSWGPSYWCQSKVTASQCGQEAYCNNQVWKAKAEVSSNVGSVQCDVCKILIGYVQQYIQNNSTESQAEAAIEEVCSKLGPLKDECDAVVQGYFPQIWQLLVNQVDPDKVCSEVGLCSSALEAKAKVESIIGSVQCDVCKLVVGLVQKQIEKNTSQAEAEAAVEKLCSVLDSLKDECKTLVDSFFPEIWQLLVDQADPDTVCSEIKLCSSAQFAKVEAVDVKSIQCDFCKIAAQYIQQFAEKNVTEAEVQKELEQLCNVLGSLKDECETLLTDFFPEFWDAIVNKLDPSTVCATIGLCSSKTTKLPKPTVSEVKVDGCTICKTVVEALQSLLLSNTTEELAMKEVKRVCIFLGPLDDECKTMIDTYFPQMWQLLQEELSPDQVCAELKLCTSSMKAVPKVVQTAQCDVCKIVALYLNKFVASNGTETEAKDAVKNLCSLLGSMSSECSSMVDMFFDEIWKMIVAETDPDTICDMLKLCTSTSLKAPKRKIALPKQTPCDLCKLLVTFAKPYVDSNSTENEVKAAVEQLCNILPGSIKSQCTTVVDDYFDTIWALVKSEFDNDLICQQIGVCNSTLSLLKLPAPKPKLSLPKQTACDVCKLAVTFLQQYVNSNTTENEVKQALEGLCSILPSEFKDECTSLVDENFNTIWLLVKSEFENGLICKQIGVCNSTVALTKQRTTVAAAQTTKPKPTMPKQNLCDLCKFAVNFIKPYVDSNSTEKEVEEALDEVCSLLPANYSGQCKTLLDTFFPTIWEMLKKDVDSGAVCSMLNLCNSTTVNKVSLAVSKPKAEPGSLCTVCKLVSAFVRQFVENRSTKADAEKAVSQLCDKLPSPYNSTCSSLVDTYFDMIWKLIDSYVDDDDLCKQLKLCNDSVALVMKEDTSGPLCVLCEFVMKELESMLDSNTTAAEIQAALDKVCSLLPSSISKDCDEFVDTYGADIIKLLLEAVSPRLVCTALHLCLTSTQEKVIVMPVVESADLKDECSVCKLVLGFVKTLVEDYQKPIEDALEDVCSLMPSAVSSECTTFVKEFAPEIIQLVDQVIDPETICKDLKLCTEQESSLLAPWKKLARAKSF